jgi:DNA-binding transcriptional LysR family regulator
MRARDLDLNLLLVFDALYHERSASRAARRLGLSQPTVSVALNKLRSVFNDQLFVKTVEGMEPTPRANALCIPIAAVLEKIKQEILIGAPFDPHTTDREFKIGFGEIGEISFLPKLLKELTLRAPSARLFVHSIAPHTIAELLEEGKIEVALGYASQLSSNVMKERLFMHTLACLASADYPLPNEPLTLAKFAAMRHALLGTPAGYYEVYEDIFKKAGVTLNVVVTTPRLVSLPQIIPGSDLVAIVPKTVARFYGADPRFREIPLPFPVKPFEINQFWHRRLQDDPASIWMRQLIRELFQERPANAGQFEPIAVTAPPARSR